MMLKRERAKKEQEFREDLEIILGIIWALTEEQPFEQLAQRAGLSVGTLYRLWGGLYVRPQFLTIQKLAAAVGMEIALTKDGIVTSLED